MNHLGSRGLLELKEFDRIDIGQRWHCSGIMD